MANVCLAIYQTNTRILADSRVCERLDTTESASPWRATQEPLTGYIGAVAWSFPQITQLGARFTVT